MLYQFHLIPYLIPYLILPLPSLPALHPLTLHAQVSSPPITRHWSHFVCPHLLHSMSLIELSFKHCKYKLVSQRYSLSTADLNLVQESGPKPETKSGKGITVEGRLQVIHKPLLEDFGSRANRCQYGTWECHLCGCYTWFALLVVFYLQKIICSVVEMALVGGGSF